MLEAAKGVEDKVQLPAFRMIRYSGKWDRQWLRCVRRQAHCLWIWAPGLVTASRWCGVVNIDEKTTICLERQIKRYMGLPAGRVAFLLYQPTICRRGDFVPRPYEHGDDLFAMWRTTHRHAIRLRFVIWRMRQWFPMMTIGLVVEDFAVRWYCRGAEPVDYLILDTPMLSNGEVDRWSDILDKPGVLRCSPVSRMTPWRWKYRWKIGFDLDDWCCQGMDEWRDPPGVWRNPTPTQQPIWVDSVSRELKNRTVAGGA